MNLQNIDPKFAAAILAAQKAVPAVIKDSVNPFHKNTYASLQAVTDAVKGAFQEQGISVLQSPAPGLDGTIALETSLIYTPTGDVLTFRASSPLSSQDPQGTGSAITYLRRYSLQSIALICPEDDDGNAAMAPRSREDAPRSTNDPQGLYDTMKENQKPGDAAKVRQEAKRYAPQGPADIWGAGKYKGKRVAELPVDYLQWVVEKSQMADAKKETARLELSRREGEAVKAQAASLDDLPPALEDEEDDLPF